MSFSEQQKNALETQKVNNIKKIEDIIEEIRQMNSDKFFIHFQENKKQAGRFRNIVTIFGKSLKDAEKEVTILNDEESQYVQLANSLKAIIIAEPQDMLDQIDLFNGKLAKLNSAQEAKIFSKNLKITILAALVITLLVGSFTLGCVCLFHPTLILALGLGTAAAISYGLSFILAIPVSICAVWSLSSDNHEGNKKVLEKSTLLAGFFKVEPIDDEAPTTLRASKKIRSELFAEHSEENALNFLFDDKFPAISEELDGVRSELFEGHSEKNAHNFLFDDKFPGISEELDGVRSELFEGHSETTAKALEQSGLPGGFFKVKPQNDKPPTSPEGGEKLMLELL